MNRLLRLAVWTVCFFCALGARAQTASIQNHCYLGGTQAKTSGLPSTNYLQGIVPSCTVTVYLTGTQTKATIYADSSSTPLANPFTANIKTAVDPGGWIFWASTSQLYDVVLSGGIPPNVYPQPVTIVGSSGSSAGNSFPTVLPIWVDPRAIQFAGGAKCDGSTDDTAALNAAAAATATLSTPQQPWGLYIPNIGHACTTTTGVTMPATNLPVYVRVDGTLRATASQTTLISVNTTSGLPISGAITGSGIIDANGLAQNAVWLHRCQKFDVRDVTTNNGTVSAVRVGDTTAGTKCTAYIDHTDDVVYNLTVSPTVPVAKTTGSTGILSDDTTDSHYDNNTIVGYDIGLVSTGGSAKVSHNHCWGHTGQVPSTCYLATAGGTYWLNDYADGFTQYGFHLERFNDILDAPQVFCNPIFCPANTAIGIQFDQAAPFAIITNGQFNGASSTPLAADINVPVTANALITSGNLANFTTVVNSQAEQSFQAAIFHSVTAQSFIVAGTSIGAPVTQTSQINAQGTSPLVGINNGGFVHFSGGVFPSLSCLSQVLTPTISGSVITFPTNGTNSSGECWAADANGNTTLINIPNSGATPATLDLSTWTVPQPPSTFNYHQITGRGQQYFNVTDTTDPWSYALQVNGTVKFGRNNSGTWVFGDPVSAPNLPQVGTPTAGHAACIKSAGPPVVIGFCSTQPDSGGACTCN
jgi:hypothetical protein